VFRRFWQWLRKRPGAVPAFDPGRELPAWFATAATAGKPRGLTWVGFDPAGEPLLVRDGDRVLSLVPAVVRFEPDPDGELADVPQAREPRTVIAVFELRRGRWETDGRTVFNLTPRQFVDRDPTRYRTFDEETP
jgi:hypothetical protein